MLAYDGQSVKERVCDFRKFAKMTQSEMADYLGMKRTAYQHREAEGNFSWEQIELLSDLFETTPIFLKYGLEDDEVRTLAIMMRETGGFKQPAFTIFDDLNEKRAELKNYSDFVCLEDVDRNRIIRYIQQKNF